MQINKWGMGNPPSLRFDQEKNRPENFPFMTTTY